uniref:Secreted protein n=1 Tax=Theropithecus gelada TaxID=9565 RepID=A0A8D2E4L8_THEGE
MPHTVCVAAFFPIPFCHWICLFCHVVNGVSVHCVAARIRIQFLFILPYSYCVAARIRIQFLFILPCSEGSLISTKKLLGAEEVNVIVRSAFKKLFQL